MIKAKLPVPEGYAIAAEAFENCVLSEDARKELSELIAMLPTKHTYAVRSSAIGEDGKEASFAGAYETLTDIKTANIMDAVKKVADSAKSERVSVYADNRSQVGGKSQLLSRGLYRRSMRGLFSQQIPFRQIELLWQETL